MTEIICSMIGSFIGAFAAVAWMFSNWDEEDIYDEQDYNDH